MISIKACMWRQIEDAEYGIMPDGLSELAYYTNPNFLH